MKKMNFVIKFTEDNEDGSSRECKQGLQVYNEVNVLDDLKTIIERPNVRDVCLIPVSSEKRMHELLYLGVEEN